MCGGSSQDSSTNNSSHFNGLEIEILEEAFAKYNWKKEKDYNFKCVKEINGVYDQLINNNLTIGAISGFTAGNFLTQKYGLVFTQPYMENPISFVAKSKKISSLNLHYKKKNIHL